jgi:hypothetical protein
LRKGCTFEDPKAEPKEIEDTNDDFPDGPPDTIFREPPAPPVR